MRLSRLRVGPPGRPEKASRAFRLLAVRTRFVFFIAVAFRQCWQTGRGILRLRENETTR
jgi:hypothetical protein